MSNNAPRIIANICRSGTLMMMFTKRSALLGALWSQRDQLMVKEKRQDG